MRLAGNRPLVWTDRPVDLALIHSRRSNCADKTVQIKRRHRMNLNWHGMRQTWCLSNNIRLLCNHWGNYRTELKFKMRFRWSFSFTFHANNGKAFPLLTSCPWGKKRISLYIYIYILTSCPWGKKRISLYIIYSQVVLEILPVVPEEV